MRSRTFILHLPAKQILIASRFDSNQVGYQRSAIFTSETYTSFRCLIPSCESNSHEELYVGLLTVRKLFQSGFAIEKTTVLPSALS